MITDIGFCVFKRILEIMKRDFMEVNGLNIDAMVLGEFTET